MQSSRSIPIVATCDIVVSGGTVQAVAAACAAAQAGADVFLVAPRTYVGEDLCGALRPWPLADDRVPRGPLDQALFPDSTAVTPLHIKKTLEDALLAAGVRFQIASSVTSIERSPAGRVTAVVVTNRSGRQALRTGCLIDAGERGGAARGSGLRFAPWPAGRPIAFRRVVLGGTVKHPDGQWRGLPWSAPYKGQAVAYHESVTDVVLSDGSIPTLADAEGDLLDLSYRRGQLRAAEYATFLPPDRLLGAGQAEDWPGWTPVPMAHFQAKKGDDVYVLSANASLPDDEAARLLQSPQLREYLGTAVGHHAATRMTRPGPPHTVPKRLEDTDGTVAQEDIREVLRGFRPTDRDLPGLRVEARPIPVWARVDVVIVGGGTSGACAAIGAARAGASVLVIETQSGLGGVGTLGLIGKPYHGRNAGFSREVPFPDKTHNIEFKMEWFRKRIGEAGGKIWFRTLGCGVVVENGTVTGAVVAGENGRGVVRANVVIDATGNADLAAAAGVPCLYDADARDIALQGTGLPARELGTNYANTDYLLVDESDALDTWRAFVGARKTMPAGAYDAGTLIQTRERRRVLGDHTLRYLDQIAGRTYPDSIVLSASDYDSHGYPTDAYFALIPHTEASLKANHPAPGGTCYTPYRCLLPKGLDGMLVIGLGMSMERDASAMVRMQHDMHNQGYAAGVAAAMAVKQAVPPRRISVRDLQRHLVDIGNLPADVLTHEDSFPPSPDRITDAVTALAQYGTAPRNEVSKALAIVLASPVQATPALRRAYDNTTGETQLVYARILGTLGDRIAVPVLLDALTRADPWDAKVMQGRMAEYAHLPTPQDSLILALGATRDRRALPLLISRLATLDATVTLSHHRSLALALEKIGSSEAARPLAALLDKPGMSGHAMVELAPLHDRDRTRRRRTPALREVVLARALYRCGDHEGRGKQILETYRGDMRGVFARHAAAVLASD